MISIIISSYKQDNFIQFEENVAETIGIDYEIIKIDNPGKMGICEAYNIGIEKAKFNYICFSHDDILFHTKNWGKILISTFTTNNKIGLIGIAGSSYKSWMPSGWAAPQMEKFPKANFLQKIHEHSSLIYANPRLEKFSETITLDGCWFCTTREVVNKFKFDQDLFKKYHCYDIDYCLNVSQEYIVGVTFEILLEHLSQGSYDKTWVEETIKLHRKWNSSLPKATEKIQKKELFNQELISYNELIRLMKTTKYNKKYQLFNIYWSRQFRSIIGFGNWLIFPFYVTNHFMNKTFVKTLYKLKIKK